MSPTLVALGAIAVLGVLYAAVPRLLLQASRRRLAARARQRRAVALTFDDGPGRELTPRVLERLDAAGVPATFFVLGCNVPGNEALIAEIERRGHEVGSHGSLHVHHLWSLPWAGVFDVRDGWRALRSAVAVAPRSRPFRPPYGRLNLLSWAWARWIGAPILMWTHDSDDTRLGRRRSPQEVADAVRTSGGGVVLLHDFDRQGATQEDVLARLDAVLALRDEGFVFVRTTELLGGPERAAGSFAPGEVRAGGSP